TRVKLYHGVTLGARSFQKDEGGKIKKGGKRHPTVEDDVTIYPNSTVLGGEKVIGARSTIGGNVFLVQSVPADSLVSYEETQLYIVQKRPRLRGQTNGCLRACGRKRINLRSLGMIAVAVRAESI